LLELHRGAARDYAQQRPLHPAQLRDQLLGKSVAEALLRRMAAQVPKRQYRKQWPRRCPRRRRYSRRRLDTDLDPWQFAPIADADARRYDLLVEFTRAPQSEAEARAFANAFDAELAAQNNEYRSKRVSRRLAAPRLCMMRQGWSDRLARSEISNGRREVQYKWKVMRDAWDAESRASVLDAFAAMSAERELPGYFIGCA
jgi:hypothetical protein